MENEVFIIVNKTSTNMHGQPRVWEGRHGWGDIHFLAHQYLTWMAADRAIKRNGLNGQFMTIEEYEQAYIDSGEMEAAQ